MAIGWCFPVDRDPIQDGTKVNKNVLAQGATQGGDNCELGWAWPILGIEDPCKLNPARLSPVENTALVNFHREEAVVEAARKAVLGGKTPAATPAAALGVHQEGGASSSQGPRVAPPASAELRKLIRAELFRARVKGGKSGEAEGRREALPLPLISHHDDGRRGTVRRRGRREALPLLLISHRHDGWGGAVRRRGGAQRRPLLVISHL